MRPISPLTSTCFFVEASQIKDCPRSFVLSLDLPSVSVLSPFFLFFLLSSRLDSFFFSITTADLILSNILHSYHTLSDKKLRNNV